MPSRSTAHGKSTPISAAPAVRPCYMSTGTPAWATGADTAASCSPERDQMLLHLRKGNRTAYRIRAATDPNVKNTVLWHGSGTLRTQPDGTDAVLVWVCCSSDTVKVEAAEAARVE